MELYNGLINNLIEELASLPGIGTKSAQRIAFHMIAIRAFDQSQPQARSPDGRIILECSEEDFNMVLCIFEILIYHSIHIYQPAIPNRKGWTLS